MTMVDGIGIWGGGESLARAVSMGLDPDRFEATFCVTRWESRPEYEVGVTELRDAGVRFLGLDRHSRYAVAPWRALLRDIRERGVDVMHTHKHGSNAWGALLRPLSRIPVLIAQEHGVTGGGSWLRSELDRRLIAPRVDAMVAVCEADRRLMVEGSAIAAEKIRVVRNGILAEPLRDRDSMRDELGIRGDAPVVGIIATLRPEKSIDVLIEAAALLAPQFPGLTVLVVGGPDSVQPEVAISLRDGALRAGVGDTVRFLGVRTDATDVISALDVAVLCSAREAGPLAIMEYMEAAKPVVATRVGGIPEIVEDGRTGILVPPDDPSSLAAAIRELLLNPALAKRYGEAGRERRRRQFDLRHTIRRFEELYEELYWQSPSQRLRGEV